VAILVLAQLLFFMPRESVAPEKVAFLLIVGALGLPFLFAKALGFAGINQETDSKWAARFALAFLVWAAVSASLATGTTLAFFGLFASQTGWFFFLLMAGAWAISTRLSPDDRTLLELAIIAGATCNGAFSFVELHINTASIGLPLYPESLQPVGTLGNPVSVGALLAAALALVTPRFVRSPLIWSPVVLLLGLGLGACGERLPVILAIAFLVGALLLVGHQARRSGQRKISSTWRALWPTVLLTLISLGTVVVGSVTSGAQGGVINYAGSASSYSTFGARLDLWDASWHVALHRPVLGYGPDHFQLATQAHYSSSLVHDEVINAEQFLTFADGHNFMIELAVTVGFVGLFLFLGWLFFSLRRRSGPLVVFALILLATELAEPLHPVITPLAFIALGAAAAKGTDSGRAQRDRSPLSREPSEFWRRWWAGPHLLGVGSWVLAMLAIIPAVLLVLGDTTLVSGEASNPLSPTARAYASTAETLLSPWAPPAQFLAVLDERSEPPKLARAVHWAQVAVSRDPANTAVLTELSGLEFSNGDFQAGRRAAAMAVRARPWDVLGLDLLGAADQVEGRTAQARRLYRESLSVYSNQPLIDDFLSGVCSPSLPGDDPSYPMSLGCKRT